MPIDLDASQRKCVEFTGPALFCIAGPGSGKTTTLTATIAHRIKSGLVHPSEVLALTFTRLAAAQMKSRLEKLVGRRAVSQMGGVGTFHSICLDIIRKHYHSTPLGFASDKIAVYDQREQRDLIKEAIFTCRRRIPQQTVLDALAHMAQTGDEHGWDAPDTESGRTQRKAQEVLDIYLRMLREHNAVDYALVPYLTWKFLNWTRLNIWFGRLHWSDIFVDEAQDLDCLQHMILATLAPQRIFFVGDADQLIYGWRGASPGMLRTAIGMAPAGSEAVVLNCNYRCPPEVVEPANALIAHNTNRIAKNMISPYAWGGRGEVVLVDEEYAISDLSESHKLIDNSNIANSCAILGRTHRIIERWSRDLREAGIEHTLIGRRDRMLERPAVKAALAVLAWPELPRCALVMERVMRAGGLGPLDLEELRQFARTEGMPYFKAACLRHESLRTFYDEQAPAEGERPTVGIVERLASAIAFLRNVNIHKELILTDEDGSDLHNLLAQFVRQEKFENRTADRFIGWLNSRDSQDDLQGGGGMVDRAGGIQLMTIHAAKGLEFDTVYIVGLEDWNLPIEQSHDDPVRMEEERRLMFVAMTRASRRLVLVLPDSDGRPINTTGMQAPRRVISRFLDEACVSRPIDESA